MKIFADPSFWVAASFVAFIGLLLFMRVQSKITVALDARSAKISQELQDAQKLREEAQALLADYQRKQREAEQIAGEIIAQARKEAEAITQETREALKQSLQRQTEIAESKIARAEAKAAAEVRSVAVDVAIQATEKLLASKLSSDSSKRLVDESITDLQGKLN